MADQSPPFFPACPDPVASAIAALQEQFRQNDKDIDQVLTGTPAQATGSFSFCNSQVPPFDWGVPPIPTVNVSPDGVVSITPASLDPTKTITVGDVTIRPYMDFNPADPKSGTFGRIETNKHFSSRKQLVGQFAITASTRVFHFSTYNSFTSDDVGRWLYVPFSAYPGNLGFHQITELVDSQTVVCGGSSSLTDEIALSMCDLVIRMFNTNDASYGRILTISGSGADDGKYVVTSFISDCEVVLNFPSTPAYYDGNLTWAVSYNINELGLMIATSRPFTTHPQVYFSHSTPTVSITAKNVGVKGNDIIISIGTGLTSFLCPSGPTLTGGKDGNLLADITTSNSAMGDVYATTDPILSLGGVSSASVSMQQNAIPPNSTDLNARLDACGFPIVGNTPVVHGDPRMRGYLEFIELCGIEALRKFLAGKPGDRYVVSIDLVPSFIPTPESCGTSEVDTLNEVPLCGITPAEAPTAVRYYVFHHTEVQTSSSSINALFTQGFNSEQISVILNPKGDIGFGVTSVVLSYTNAIEEALFHGYTLDDILGVLNKGIEDWKYDASPADMRAEINRLRIASISSTTSQSCFIRYVGGIKGDKVSGASQGLTNIDLDICEVVSLSLKTAVKFALSQMGKVNKTVAKVNDVLASLSSALSFSNFVNNTLTGFPSNPTMKCLLGSINLSAVDPGAAIGAALGTTPTDLVSNFANNINPKINFGASAVKATLDRSMTVLNTAAKSVCLLQSTVSSLIQNSLGQTASNVFNCLATGLNFSLPQCVIDSLNELSSLLTSLQASIDLSLSVAANLVAAMAKMAKMDIADPVTGQTMTCPDQTVSSFVNSLKSPLNI